MKKSIALSAITLGLLSSASLNAADDLSSMFSEGKVSGQIREYSITRSKEYSSPTGINSTRSANAIGGYLKYETAAYKGLSFGTAFYTTNGFGLDSPRTAGTVDPTLLGTNNESYSMLGEAFVKFEMDKTVFIGGRQKIKNPMISSDDARMLPNLVEEYSLTNTNISNTTLSIAHTTKFAQGTFGQGYGGGVLGATGGYSALATGKKDVGEFVNMGTYAVGQSTSGVTSVSAVYTGVEGLKLQLWDFYAHDIMNTIYAEAAYKMKLDSVSPFVAAQFMKQNDVGDSLLKNTAISTNGKLDSMYYAVKAGASIENFTAYLAYSQTSANSDSDVANDGFATNSIVSMWGGMPGYTQGMVTRHHNMAGTKATKLAASYNWKSFGPDIKTIVYYANFDMDKNNGYTSADAKETGFDIIYNTGFIKNLQLRLRGNYADDFNVAANGDTYGHTEYRFIANYNF